MKICPKCKLLLDDEDFYKITAKRKTGNIKVLKSSCKKCDYNIQKMRREKEKNEDPIKYNKKWSDYYNKVREHNIEMKKIYMSKEENKIKRREYIRQYKKNRLDNDINYKIKENIRKRIWKSTKNKKDTSFNLLGCNINDYIKWIEYTMKPDMNWDNYGSLWNIDHIIPISSFDLTNVDEQYNAFNWKNTWALYSNVNCSKKDNINEELINTHNILLNSYINHMNG